MTGSATAGSSSGQPAADQAPQPGRLPALDDRLAAAFERLAQATRVMRWDAAYAHGLSPVQLTLLDLLGSAPPGRRRVSALAAEVDLTPPTVSDAVAALRRKGLVTATPAFGRGHLLDLTDGGRDVLQAVDRWDRPLLDALTAVPVEAKETTLVTLLEAIAGLQRAGVVTVARMCTTCRFFEQGGSADGTGPGVPHCGLLDAPLPPQALRVDCPEHEQAG